MSMSVHLFEDAEQIDVAAVADPKSVRLDRKLGWLPTGSSRTSQCGSPGPWCESHRHISQEVSSHSIADDGRGILNGLAEVLWIPAPIEAG